MTNLTNGKLSEHIKIDSALNPISLATTNATGGYHGMKGWKRALFKMNAAAIADTVTAIAQVMEATDAAATGAQVLTGAAATITGSLRATRALLTGNTIVDGTTTVTVTAHKRNGDDESAVFICEDTTPDIDAGEFASGANDTAAMVELAAAINHLLGDWILATPSTTTCILTAAEPGEVVISLTACDATIVPSTLEAIAIVEIDAAQLSAGYSHVALRATTGGTIVVAGELTREEATGGGAVDEQVAACWTVL